MKDHLTHKQLSTFMLLLILAVYIPFLHAGTLTATGDNPIDVSVANKNEIADYTFYFIPDTTIPVGGTLTVTFPTQYAFGLGFAISPTCTVTCSISAYSVVFVFTSPVLNGVTSSVTIKSVTNPTTKGGTGNFKLVSKTGDNVLDQNLVFGVIGIADTIGTLTSTSVSLDSAGVLNAGEVTKYAFSFKVSQTIPAQSYMKFIIQDTNFGLSTYPSCSAFSINGKIISGKLTCQTVGREVYVRGLSAAIPAGQDVGITVSMTNPPFSGTTAEFTLAIFRNGTNAIYDRRTGIPGIPITAGTLSNVAMTLVDTSALQARNKEMDYTLTFLPKNALKLGSVIALTIPSTYTINAGSCFIVSGLDDISEDSTVGMNINVVTNVITLTNFKAITTPQLVSLQLRLKNPDNAGVTTPIYIQTFTDTTLVTLIDQDVTNAVTYIRNLPSPTSHAINDSTQATSLTLSMVEFNVTPSVSVLGGYVVKIRVPDGFSVKTVKTANCYVKSLNTASAYVAAGACSNIDNLITLTFPATASFPLGNAAQIRLTNVITTPANNGTYLFDLTTYRSDGVTAVESWTDYFIATSIPFPLYSTSSLCKGIGLTTVLTYTFTTGLAVPAGIQQTKASDLKGFIELGFDTNIAIAQLGGSATAKTSVPCRPNSGLSPLSGGTVKCYVFPTTPPSVRIENFEAIPANTIVSISFPKVTNPIANFTVLVKTIQLNNRIRTQLNSVLTTVTTETPTALTESGSVGSSAYVFSSNKVSTFTNITFNPGTSTVINGPGKFILEFPSFDIGWIPVSNTIGCKLDTTYYPCTRYDGADWVVITFPSGATFPTGRTITIENVRVPRYRNPSATGILLRYIMGSNDHERVNRPQQYFPTASVPTFMQASLIADKKSKGAVDAKYAMIFTPYYALPAGSSIVITFPTSYSILSSYPPAKFSSPDLVDISSSQAKTFTPSVQTLTITNYAAHPAQTSFSVIVEGLRNPSNVLLSTGWQAEVYMNGNQLVLHSNFDQFAFTDALSPGTITFNYIQAFPLNTGETADYTISFVPTSTVPAGGQIRITFPSTNFASLPNPASCSLTGGITTFQTCTLSGFTYVIVLDQTYSTGGISVTIADVTNPSVGTTDGFVVSTYYDGAFLDQTDSSDSTGRTVTITSAPSPLAVQSLTCDPKNEGEPSTYTFVFLPTNPVTSDMVIRFEFPDAYDPMLGANVACDTTSGLLGDVACAIGNRVVTLSGFDTYTPDADSPISVSVYGVINPNQNINSNTGQFKVATYYQNTQVFIDSNDAAGSFEPIAAPGWSTLYNITATNLNSRLKADYTFNFTSYLGVLSTLSQGAVLVDYPSDFSLDSQSLTCTSKTAAFASATALSCSVTRNRVTVKGQTVDYTGNVGFVVKQIKNPIEEGTAGNIVLKIYDGFNAVITERSYRNLDPFAFAYTFPGPQIIANNNATIRVERGTQTQDLYLTLDYPCALNLTIRPTTPGFNIVPSTIPLTLGMIKSKFRVSVDEDFPTGTYEISWETLNDLDTPFYTPLKNTKVIVTALTNLRITVPSLYEVPFGGNSLPSYFSVDYGPDVGYEILLSLLDDYPGITLDRRNVIFTSGVQQSAFIVYSSNDTNVTGGVTPTTGSVNFALSGINKDVYALSSTSLDFQIIDADPTPPQITELSVTDITMNSASIVIGSSEIVLVYYMIALAGTAIPPVEEIINGGPAPYTTTRSVYGSAIIGTENMVTITASDLIAETPYQVYVYIYDRGGNTNTPRSQVFTTLNRYNAADFSLKFKQSFLNSAERANIIETIAFVLSLPTYKVQERKYIISVSSGSRLLEENENETLPTEVNEEGRMLASDISIMMYLQIMAIPESSVYPSPVDLARLLNTRSSMLDSRLTNFDTSYTISGTAFTRYIPGFPTAPTSPSLDWNWAEIGGSLNNYGWIYCVFIKAAQDYGKPSPYQISNGLNNYNVQNPSGKVEVSEAYKVFSINVTGLDPETDYNVYTIGGSAHPGYPDLFSSDDIVIITLRTNPAPTTPHLNINDGSILEVRYMIFFIIASIFCFLI